MANAVYDIYKTAVLSGSANVSLNVNDATDGPFISLIDTNDVAFSQAHDFYDDVQAANVGTSQRIVSPTVGTVAQGVFDGADPTWPLVIGDVCEAVIIYRHNSGAAGTWRLVVFLDASITGLPVTPNGGDISLAFNATGIFKL